jgi:hypothetical protein
MNLTIRTLNTQFQYAQNLTCAALSRTEVLKSWKFYNKMVEKFQMTGSAMGKKITEELEKKLSALVHEQNEVPKNLSAYWLFYVENIKPQHTCQ